MLITRMLVLIRRRFELITRRLVLITQRNVLITWWLVLRLRLLVFKYPLATSIRDGFEIEYLLDERLYNALSVEKLENYVRILKCRRRVHPLAYLCYFDGGRFASNCECLVDP